MYRKLAIGLVAFLATGMASAAYLHSYGTVEGDVDVQGPNLVAAGADDLLISREPDESTAYYLRSLQLHFYSSPEIDTDWYPVNATMRVEARAPSGAADLDLSFVYSNSKRENVKVCSTQTVEVDSSSYRTYNASCSGEIKGNVESFDYYIGNFDPSNDIYVRADGDTRIEVRRR
jgi:hypothetical protein